MAVDYSLLVLAAPAAVERPRRRGGGAAEFHVPAPARQIRRLTPQFRVLQQVFEAQRARLAASAQGAQPEQVLVLEIVGTVDEFANAVRRIAGFEWLAEWDVTDVAADEDFYREAAGEGTLSGRLFLLMSNQEAMRQLLRLWRSYQANPQARFEYGLQRFRRVFEQLRSIRPWGPSDRLAETNALSRWQEQLALGAQTIRIEAELWFRANDARREEGRRRLEADVRQANGRVLLEAAIPEISYHGVLAEVPSASIRAVVERQEYAAWVTCNDVMVFGAVGQSIVALPDAEPLQQAVGRGGPMPRGDPTVALLDGLPIENHRHLAGRLRVDDPDGLAANYPARSRIHGTSMASLIIHGDLERPGLALGRPLYVRPVMEPEPAWVRRRGERIPEGQLPVDLIHRAVRRLFEQTDGGPVAPSVRILNLALGDPGRVFDRSLSPWARLLDWLAHRYRLLILVSAGNHFDLSSGEPSNTLLDGTPAEQETIVVRAVEGEARFRRLLSPAESINSVTVAATHADFSPPAQGGLTFDPYVTDGMPSPVNGLGLGYRRAVKPDLLFPGGRQLLLRPLRDIGPPTNIQLAELNAQPPGALAALPGNAAGDISATGYVRGTSVATALAARSSAELLDELLRLRTTSDVRDLDPQLDALLVKALLVHSATWGPAAASLRASLRIASPANFREHLARFLGYGVAFPQRVMACTEQRATMIRSDWLQPDQSHVYDVPLPPSLNGRAEWRRLIVTLAWLTPISPSSRGYRRAALTYTRADDADPLQVNRQEVDTRAVGRGTIQHEVFEGTQASAYVDGARLRLRVDCREDTGPLEEMVPYAIAVTLEVREGVAVPIYQEIRDRIRLPVQVRPR